MKTEITINKDKLLAAYNGASDEQKQLLESMYGKDTFKSENFMDRIKTFEDACKELGDIHSFVVAFKIAEANGAFGPDVIAYLKLRIICAALNEGWKPQFTEDEYRWYPLFTLWKEEELKDKSEEWKAGKKLWLFGGSSLNASACGLASAGSSGAWTNSDSDDSARLAVKSEELADYFGKQFIDIWADFLFA